MAELIVNSGYPIRCPDSQMCMYIVYTKANDNLSPPEIKKKLDVNGKLLEVS